MPGVKGRSGRKRSAASIAKAQQEKHIPKSSGKPRQPRGMKGESLKFWKWVVPQLDEMGILGAADEKALQGLCEWWAAYRAASAAGDLKAMSESWRHFANGCTAFGLTPQARSNLKLPPKSQSDPLTDYIRSRGGLGIG